MKLRKIHIDNFKLFILFTISFFQTSIYAEDYHPADTNHDWRISEDEFKTYDSAWKKTQEWPVGPNPIPASYAARAAYLFLKAPCYGSGNAIAPLSWDFDKDCDGAIDSIDLCPDDSNKIQAGICGCGKAETGDRDKDKTLDCVDLCPDDSNKVKPDICGCGKAETDRDNDKTLDCEDQCPDDPKKIKPGNCGCGQTEIIGCPVDNQNGTITYRSTCLMWQKQTAPSKMDWYDAKSYCNNLTLAGHSNWRLPTREELKFIDKTIHYFPDTVSDYYYYWSSTSETTYRAWGVNFGNTWLYESKQKSDTNYVRAVSSGQCR
ncbi:secreted protein containing DUF1566 [Candidatus Magnetomorum sp. HK-1]|nr:secreted protein containing DUF1566 [Candidatus Magnetomorum sp. HK-1]